MKKLTACFVVVLLTGSLFAQDMNFSFEPAVTASHPLQLALYSKMQLVPFTDDVAGLRLNIIGLNENVTGLDIGLINQTAGRFRGAAIGLVNRVGGDVTGVELGFLNHVSGDMIGFQGIPILTFWNAVNIVHGRSIGMQGGLYNQSETIRGAQTGLVNIGYDMAGLQLGLYNYTENMTGAQLGLVNIAYVSGHGFQAGLYNGAAKFRGFQLGLVNQTQVLEGLQIGILNVASQKDVMPAMVIANWQF